MDFLTPPAILSNSIIMYVRVALLVTVLLDRKNDNHLNYIQNATTYTAISLLQSNDCITIKKTATILKYFVSKKKQPNVKISNR